MNALFLYGTLCIPQVFELVTEYRLSSLTQQGARLQGYQAYYVVNEAYPGLKEEEGGVVNGIFIEVSDSLLEKLWVYESQEDYSLRKVTLQDEQGRPKEANLFYPKKALELSHEVWDLKQWSKNIDMDQYLDLVRIWMSQDTV